MKLTMRQLADLLSEKYHVKISSSMIYRWENGATPALTPLFIIAIELKIDLNELAAIVATSNQR